MSAEFHVDRACNFFECLICSSTDILSTTGIFDIGGRTTIEEAQTRWEISEYAKLLEVLELTSLPLMSAPPMDLPFASSSSLKPKPQKKKIMLDLTEQTFNPNSFVAFLYAALVIFGIKADLKAKRRRI
jgi:hypothetical protein